MAINYSRRLVEDLFSVIGAALADLKPAQLSYGLRGGAFRSEPPRTYARGRAHRHKPQRAIDPQVPILRMLSEAGRLRAVVFGYACHNTASNGRSYQLSGDYAGFAQIDLEKRHPGATAMFIMLCGGDQNPSPHGSIELAWSHGKTLAGEVNRVLETVLSPIEFPHSDGIPEGFS